MLSRLIPNIPPTNCRSQTFSGIDLIGWNEHLKKMSEIDYNRVECNKIEYNGAE